MRADVAVAVLLTRSSARTRLVWGLRSLITKWDGSAATPPERARREGGVRCSLRPIAGGPGRAVLAGGSRASLAVGFVAVPRAPLVLLGAALVELTEGGVVAALGVFVGSSALLGTPDELGRALALAAFTAIGGVAMVLVGIALLRRRRWARAPAVVTQVLALPVGVSLAQSGQVAIGVSVLVIAVSGLILLFAQPSTRAFLQDHGQG